MAAGPVIPDEIRALVDERQHARAERDFARADELRDAIAAAGYALRDTPEGPVVEPATRFTAVDPRSVPNTLSEPASVPVSIHLLHEGFPGDVARFLDAFAAHNDVARAEVVIVDNGSADGDALEDLAARRARVLHLDREVGWAAARNAGLKGARGAIVVIADLSIEPAGDIVGPLERAFEDPAVGLAGPYGLVTHDMMEWRDDAGPVVDAIEGYLLAARRESFARELIHERFAWYRNADLDLSLQVRAQGYGARVVPLPVVKHEHRGWAAVPDEERPARSKRNHAIVLERWRARTDLLTRR